MMTTDSHWPQPQREREERAMASEAFFLSHNRLVVDRYRSRVLEIFVIFNCESSSSTRADEICLSVCLSVCLFVCAICEIHLLKVHQANQSTV